MLCVIYAMTDLLTKLPSNVRGEYRVNAPLAQLTWFKVGGNAEVLFKPYDVSDLQLFLSQISDDIHITIIGVCSNTLVRDGGVDGVVIKLARGFTEIILLEDNMIKIGAAALNYNTAKYCLEHYIKGFEFLVGIPGTAGGGVAMNAGAYGKEFKDIVYSVEAIDRKGEKHIIKNEDIGFLYRKNNLPRDLIFTSITCKYAVGNKEEIQSQMDYITTSRLASQPVKEKTCGSTFRNPLGHKAWQLINDSGLHNIKVGGAELSQLHSNFIVNTGNATADDIEKLVELIRNTVLSKTGIVLECEIKTIGKK